MITAERKPMEEIIAYVRPYDRILLVGCNECVTVCAAGGRKEVGILSSALQLALLKQGKTLQIREHTLERQCDPEYAEELAPLVDVIEVFNARLHPGRLNAPAEALARRHGRLRGAGSDAHTLGELGGARVVLPAHPNRPDALLRALARGEPSGRTASNLVHLASTWAKVRKRLPGAPSPSGPLRDGGTGPSHG